MKIVATNTNQVAQNTAINSVKNDVVNKNTQNNAPSFQERLNDGSK